MCLVKVAKYSTLKPEPSSSAAFSSDEVSLLLACTTFQIYKKIKLLYGKTLFYSNIIVASAGGQFIGIQRMKVDRINWLLVVPVDLKGFGFHFELGALACRAGAKTRF